MRRVPIALPEIGSDACRLSLWFVRIGESVREGDRVAEVVFPGAVVDVAAPADGILVERLALPGDALSSGQSLGTIEAADS